MDDGPWAARSRGGASPRCGLRQLSAREVILLAFIGFPGLASAQTSSSRLVPNSRPDQSVERAPPASARIDPKPATAPSAAVPAFRLDNVDVAGSSLGPSLSDAWRPFIGRTVDRAALTEISDRIVSAYRRSDIALYTVLIPSQTFADHVVHVRAFEGRVEDVRIEGGRRQRHLLELYAKRLTSEHPLRKRTLQRYLTLMRDIPGVKADVELVNGVAGDAARIVVRVEDEPVQLALAINNRGTAYLGRTQYSADLYLNGAFRSGDQTRLTFAAPTDFSRFQYYSLVETQPLNASGTSLQLNAAYLRTRPSGLDLSGHAESLGAQILHPLIRSYDTNLNLAIGLDGINSNSALLGVRLSDERTRAFRIAATYGHQSDERSFSGSGALSIGINGLGARPIDPMLSDVSFTKLNVRTNFSANVGGPLVLRFNTAAQWSGDRLPPSEQFALGGNDFGRGYEAAVIAGDYGLAAAAELALHPQRLPERYRGSEAYVFADAGALWYRSRLGFPGQEAHLASAGLGARLALGLRSTAQVEATRTLPNDLAYLDRGEWRVIFTIRTLR